MPKHVIGWTLQNFTEKISRHTTYFSCTHFCTKLKTYLLYNAQTVLYHSTNQKILKFRFENYFPFEAKYKSFSSKAHWTFHFDKQGLKHSVSQTLQGSRIFYIYIW